MQVPQFGAVYPRQISPGQIIVFHTQDHHGQKQDRFYRITGDLTKTPNQDSRAYQAEAVSMDAHGNTGGKDQQPATTTLHFQFERSDVKPFDDFAPDKRYDVMA